METVVKHLQFETNLQAPKTLLSCKHSEFSFQAIFKKNITVCSLNKHYKISKIAQKVPVEKDIRFSILNYCLVHFCYILIIKLVPLSIDHILTVSYVVTTCSKGGKNISLK